MKSEKFVTKECIKFLKEKGFICIRINQLAGSTPGVSDYVCCYLGKFYAIEFKKEKNGILSVNQKLFKKKIEQAGGIYLIINSVETLKKELNDKII